MQEIYEYFMPVKIIPASDKISQQIFRNLLFLEVFDKFRIMIHE